MWLRGLWLGKQRVFIWTLVWAMHNLFSCSLKSSKVARPRGLDVGVSIRSVRNRMDQTEFLKYCLVLRIWNQTVSLVWFTLNQNEINIFWSLLFGLGWNQNNHFGGGYDARKEASWGYKGEEAGGGYEGEKARGGNEGENISSSDEKLMEVERLQRLKVEINGCDKREGARDCDIEQEADRGNEGEEAVGCDQREEACCKNEWEETYGG